MNLMEQLRKWNENGEYQKIIDTVEEMQEEELAPELISELARAYNNIAEPGDKEMLEKAIRLLKPLEEALGETYSWNYRMAYAYYYLDEEGQALLYFERALEAQPGDEDVQQYITDCRRRLALPRFEMSFRERTAAAWAEFEAGEARIRELLDCEDRNGVSEELTGECSRLLSVAFSDVSFELGFNGEKYELILTPEGNRARLFPLVYFQQHAPAGILNHWNILVGRQASRDFALSAFGESLSGSDVLVWVETTGDSPEDTSVSLKLFCEKLLPLLYENEDQVWWLLTTLLDQILGEIPSMKLVEEFDILCEPMEMMGITLDELPEMLQKMGIDTGGGAEDFLENSYIAYQREPDQDPEAGWRRDVFVGSTRCIALINEYMNGETVLMDYFHRDGIVAGFFSYPLDCFDGEEERSRAVLDFRDALTDYVLEHAGSDSVCFLGGASGTGRGYLDFIAWDLDAVLKAAITFFRDSPLRWAVFHAFRWNVNAVSLVDKEREETTE